jgi:hypothetical protein
VKEHVIHGRGFGVVADVDTIVLVVVVVVGVAALLDIVFRVHIHIACEVFLFLEIHDILVRVACAHVLVFLHTLCGVFQLLVEGVLSLLVLF